MSTDKVILVDLDGVVYGWVEHMAMLFATTTLTNYSAPELMNLHRSWEVWEDWDIPKGEFNHYWDHWIREGIMYSGLFGDRRIEPILGAREGMWKLSDNGWHIHIVTSRFDRSGLHEEAAMSTVAWLADTGIPYDSLTFTADKHNIMGEVIVDDRAHNLINHPAPIHYLYPAQHNQSLTSNEEYVILDYDSPWGDLTDILCYD